MTHELAGQNPHIPFEQKQLEGREPEFNPLEGVQKHWHQAQLCFQALREQFPDIGTTAQFSEPIQGNIPTPRNHYGYDNDAEFKRELIPSLYKTDIVVKSLGLATMTTDSPFNELQELMKNRTKREMPPPLVK